MARNDLNYGSRKCHSDHTRYIPCYEKCRDLFLCLLLIAAAAVQVQGVAYAGPDPSEEPQTASLIQALKSGGFVVYLRHAATDRTQVDQDRNDLTTCTSQRNLSDTGRAQARAIGEAVSALRIPIGSVITSPYCRCQDTAELAFGKSEVTDDLRFGLGDDIQQTAHLSQALKNRLSTPPAPGTNTVLVSHTANLKEAAGIWPQPEGAAFLFRPLPGVGFEYIGRVPPEAWIQQLPAASVTSAFIE
ncbi:MAG: histidine phosphatase family protein [Gammaproteobacteria bacterium]